ncbi:MAG: SMI1/KNR4 family protein [Nostoc sp.]|uniref:SMI1/KNR4 family protein n=1 Tax=unclassified Nostoc TaxID=2593658 RepID=UPI000C0454FC|nr:SMI1/KNR4 family protein [Nostoc sp. 'Peltigera malacea cyanobiont' DB3992]PHM08463.1 hypothetical protein CK516_20680 [Nostoc sp. 'Peltigera malacea cyanobiont' DB3992]
MSELTEGLKRIHTWFSKNIPERISYLAPGLSREDIEQSTRFLPFKLPEEVYELYQWRNGSSGYNFLFENYEFMSLNAAVSAYHEQMGEIRYHEREEAYWFEHSFPIFQLWCNGGVLYTVMPNAQRNSIIRIYDSECNDYSLRYDNLTNLMLHGADWYEAAYFVEKEKVWDIINEEMNCLLDVKYMARDYLANSITRKGTAVSRICEDIYQRYINGDISLPNA